MAAPHVAGIAALMAQTSPGLSGPDVEAILERTAIPLDAGCRTEASAKPGKGRGR